MGQEIMWLAGVSITGFLVLAGWSYNLHGKVSGMEATARKVDEIHAALLGTMADEGLLSKFRRQQERCLLHKAIVEGKITFNDQA